MLLKRLQQKLLKEIQMNWKNKGAAAKAAGGTSTNTTTATPAKTSYGAGASSGGSKPKRVTVLDIRVVDTKNGKQSKVQFAKDIEIYFKGEKVEMGEYNSAFLKTKDELISDLDFLVDKEYITGEQAQEKADFLDEKNITSQLVVALK